MKLPYQPPISEPWKKVDIASLTKQEFRDYLETIPRQTSDAILAAMITDVSFVPNCIGVCLIEATAHDYKGQDLAIQYHNGTFLVQTWSEAFETEKAQPFMLNLDLRVELHRLRQEGLILRQHRVNRNVDRKSGMENRNATIYLVVGTEAEWVACPSLLQGGEYENNAANRILRAVYRMDNDITLV